MTLTPEPAPQVARSPREALAAIQQLCDSTSWIVSANDIRPILASVVPAGAELDDEQLERLETLEAREVDFDWAQEVLRRVTAAGIQVTLR